MNKQISQDSVRKSLDNWKAVVRDDFGHHEVCYGKSFDDVWEEVAMVEDFDIPSTVCTIYAGRYPEKVPHYVHEYWFEAEYLYGSEDEALVQQLVKYNDEEKRFAWVK